MAFSYTVASVPTTTIVANKGNFSNNMQIVSGTWTGGADATGTIVTGLTNILLCSCDCTEVKNESPKFVWNKTGAGAAQAGSIGITAMADATNNTGLWFALGY